MKNVIVACVVGLVGVIGTVEIASAQDIQFGAHHRPSLSGRGNLGAVTARWDTYAFGENQDTAGAHTEITSWANMFSASADLGEFVFALAIPLGYAHSTTSVAGVSRSSDQAELGNIELEGFADIDIGPEHRLLIGGGIALPTATDQLGSGGGFGGVTGYAVRQVGWRTSFRNPAAWADQSFGIWPEIAYRFQSEWVLLTATGSIPFFLPTSGSSGGAVLQRGNVEMMMMLDVAGAVRILDAVDAGVSFLGWALPSGAGVMGNPDLGQTAATIFVRTDDMLDLPVGGGFEMIFNLDNSWGPTGDSGKFWGAHIFVYGRFDVGSSGAVSTSDWDPSTGDGGTGATTDGTGTGDGTSTTGTGDGSTTDPSWE
jgi:hypothetical protein